MKPLNLKGYRGRQFQKALRRHLGLTPDPSSRAMLHDAGKAIHIWVVSTDNATPQPAANRIPEPAYPAPSQHGGEVPGSRYSPRYSWATYDDSARSSSQREDGLSVLSRNAVRFVVGAGDVSSVDLPASTLALDAEEFNSLRAVLGEGTLGGKKTRATPAADAAALLDWLWSFRRNDSPWTRAVAGAVACAGTGSQPLWLELGLSGRDPLNILLAGHFPALYRLNQTHMGWKKFFYLRCTALHRAPSAASLTQK